MFYLDNILLILTFLNVFVNGLVVSKVDHAECRADTSINDPPYYNSPKVDIFRRESKACISNPISPDSSTVTPKESTQTGSSSNPCTDEDFTHHVTCGGFEVYDELDLSYITHCVEGNVWLLIQPSLFLSERMLIWKWFLGSKNRIEKQGPWPSTSLVAEYCCHIYAPRVSPFFSSKSLIGKMLTSLFCWVGARIRSNRVFETSSPCQTACMVVAETLVIHAEPSIEWVRLGTLKKSSTTIMNKVGSYIAEKSGKFSVVVETDWWSRC